MSLSTPRQDWGSNTRNSIFRRNWTIVMDGRPEIIQFWKRLLPNKKKILIGFWWENKIKELEGDILLTKDKPGEIHLLEGQGPEESIMVFLPLIKVWSEEILNGPGHQTMFLLSIYLSSYLHALSIPRTFIPKIPIFLAFLAKKGTSRLLRLLHLFTIMNSTSPLTKILTKHLHLLHNNLKNLTYLVETWTLHSMKSAYLAQTPAFLTRNRSAWRWSKISVQKYPCE